jgi:hypothetical protein
MVCCGVARLTYSLSLCNHSCIEAILWKAGW